MERQPVHTFYEGAHLYRINAAREHGAAARAALEEHAPTAETFAHAIGAPASPRFEEIHERVLRRLREDPVEDYRIDFEEMEKEDVVDVLGTGLYALMKANGALPGQEILLPVWDE